MFDQKATPEQERRRRLLENRAWLDENFDAVQKEYADKWIAILDQQVAHQASESSILEEKLGEREREAVILRVPTDSISKPM
jgi:hypothetical protein